MPSITGTPDEYKRSEIMDTIRQSDPIDYSIPFEDDWVRGKTILITGGASGFGAGFFERWAEHGATVIIGDVNVKGGENLVAEARTKYKNENLHFIRLDVTNWESQVNFFKKAAELSPTKGIDTVVANAGITENMHHPFESPSGLDADVCPPPPMWPTIDVNLTGVLYTAHCALFWLQKNPGSKPAGPSTDPATAKRDRHLLLVGSGASLGPIPSQPLYGVSKHGVLGLFRCLRSTSFFHGIRVNMLCPFFIATPLIPAAGRILLAGTPVGKVEHVVNAGTRLVADSRICGRATMVGPEFTVNFKGDGDWVLVEKGTHGATSTTEWEAFAHDWEQTEAFGSRVISMINLATKARGWTGWFSDVFGAIKYGIFGSKR